MAKPYQRIKRLLNITGITASFLLGIGSLSVSVQDGFTAMSKFRESFRVSHYAARVDEIYELIEYADERLIQCSNGTLEVDPLGAYHSIFKASVYAEEIPHITQESKESLDSIEHKLIEEARKNPLQVDSCELPDSERGNFYTKAQQELEDISFELSRKSIKDHLAVARLEAGSYLLSSLGYCLISLASGSCAFLLSKHYMTH